VLSVAGLVVGLATFLPFYLLRGFGAGDVKAMAAVGAFLGPKGVLLAAGLTLACGALGAVLVVMASGGLAVARRRRFPYGLAIACGTVASLAWS
jgi:prepilin peptidase CpaA